MMVITNAHRPNSKSTSLLPANCILGRLRRKGCTVMSYARRVRIAWTMRIILIDKTKLTHSCIDEFYHGSTLWSASWLGNLFCGGNNNDAYGIIRWLFIIGANWFCWFIVLTLVAASHYQIISYITVRAFFVLWQQEESHCLGLYSEWICFLSTCCSTCCIRQVRLPAPYLFQFCFLHVARLSASLSSEFPEV